MYTKFYGVLLSNIVSFVNLRFLYSLNKRICNYITTIKHYAVKNTKRAFSLTEINTHFAESIASKASSPHPLSNIVAIGLKEHYLHFLGLLSVNDTHSRFSRSSALSQAVCYNPFCLLPSWEDCIGFFYSADPFSASRVQEDSRNLSS